MSVANEKAAPMPGGGGEVVCVRTSNMNDTTTAPGVQENPRKAAALAWAQAGYRVVPCEFMGHVPSVAGGFLAASSDEGQVAAWWDQGAFANVAVATGRGLVALVCRSPRAGFFLSRAGLSRRQLDSLTPSAFRLPHHGRVLFFRADHPVASRNQVLGRKSGLRIVGENDGLLVPPSRLPSLRFPGGFHAPPCVGSLPPWSAVAPYLED